MDKYGYTNNLPENTMLLKDYIKFKDELYNTASIEKLNELKEKYEYTKKLDIKLLPKLLSPENKENSISFLLSAFIPLSIDNSYVPTSNINRASQIFVNHIKSLINKKLLLLLLDSKNTQYMKKLRVQFDKKNIIKLLLFAHGDYSIMHSDELNKLISHIKQKLTSNDITKNVITYKFDINHLILPDFSDKKSLHAFTEKYGKFDCIVPINCFNPASFDYGVNTKSGWEQFVKREFVDVINANVEHDGYIMTIGADLYSNPRTAITKSVFFDYYDREYIITQEKHDSNILCIIDLKHKYNIDEQKESNVADNKAKRDADADKAKRDANADKAKRDADADKAKRESEKNVKLNKNSNSDIKTLQESIYKLYGDYKKKMEKHHEFLVVDTEYYIPNKTFNDILQNKMPEHAFTIKNIRNSIVYNFNIFEECLGNYYDKTINYGMLSKNYNNIPKDVSCLEINKTTIDTILEKYKDIFTDYLKDINEPYDTQTDDINNIDPILAKINDELKKVDIFNKFDEIVNIMNYNSPRANKTIENLMEIQTKIKDALFFHDKNEANYITIKTNIAILKNFNNTYTSLNKYIETCNNINKNIEKYKKIMADITYIHNNLNKILFISIN